jgi:hypothetical protein
MNNSILPVILNNIIPSVAAAPALSEFGEGTKSFYFFFTSNNNNSAIASRFFLPNAPLDLTLIFINFFISLCSFFFSTTRAQNFSNKMHQKLPH